eukprot:TRINITY_DN13027_c0_g1_i1.p1 TRINITY_DN13027_c0_g1~~TRINITY_DN13027_c0_g1_i1.p1  ORF type:complete len:278 (+),score=36.85 TRINITY_DN13027_c0_g1_i1:62-895(+)
MAAQAGRPELPSTWMLKGLPSRCAQEDVLDAIEKLGFGGTYDFFYMPQRRPYGKSSTHGLAFINFVDPAVGQQFCARVHNQVLQIRNSLKVAIVVAANMQGLESLREHFLHKAVMKCEAAPIFVGSTAPAMRRKKHVVKETVPPLGAPLWPGGVVADVTPDRENASVPASDVEGKQKKNTDPLNLQRDTDSRSDAMQSVNYTGESSMPVQTDTAIYQVLPTSPGGIVFVVANSSVGFHGSLSQAPLLWGACHHGCFLSNATLLPVHFVPAFGMSSAP